MNTEMQFAKILEEVRSQARKQGNCISEKQVKEAFACLSLNEEQLKLVYDYLITHKIGIGEPLCEEDYLSEEEKDYLSEYIEEIKVLSNCSEVEKNTVTIDAMAGEEKAKKRLVELYLSDVPQMAKLYAGQGVLLEDLIGEGNMALLMGVEMLATIEQPGEVQGLFGRLMMDAMESLIRENEENKKADEKIVKRINKVADHAKDLSAEYGRKVSVEELSEESGMSQKTIREAMRMSGFQIEDISE